MNIQAAKTVRTLSIAVIAMLCGFASVNSTAATLNATSGNNAKMVYQSRSANNNIYSYASPVPGKTVANPELIYVNRANGTAIHSYAHAGTDKKVPLSVEYVDTASGQAIYSYEQRRKTNSDVKILPLSLR